MRRMLTGISAVLVGSGWLGADDSAWRTPGSPIGSPVLPPPRVEVAPAQRSSGTATGAAWVPSQSAAPVWSPVSQPVAPPAAKPAAPAPIIPPIPVPTLPGAQESPKSPSKDQPKPKDPEVIPLPRMLPPKITPGAGEKPKLPAPPRLPEPRPIEPDRPGSQPPPATLSPVPEVLEPAPAGVFAPAGVPMRHKTFGSPNLTLSRDYHFLDLFGLGLVGEEADTVVLGEGPATDRYFVQTEYLLWWVNQMEIPVLATTGRGQSLGYLGQPGTEILLGPGGFGTTSRNGFRVRSGAWLDDWRSGSGVSGSFFFLGERSNTFQVDSTQTPTIARPFFAPNFNAEFGELVAFPGLASGTLRVDSESFLWGADVNLRQCICRTCASRSEWFAGYRHLNLREELAITEFLLAGPTAPDPVGTRVVVRDSFRVRNQFHGGQIGIAVGRQRGRWDLDARLSVALGVTHQELEIAGTQLRSRPGEPPAGFNGGLLAAGPNLGSFDTNKFSVAPEATFNIGYMVTPTVRAYVGYNFLYWSNVARPGNQIDRTVDVTYIPNGPPAAFSGQRRPLPTFRQSDLWAQGLQFGLEVRW